MFENAPEEEQRRQSSQAVGGGLKPMRRIQEDFVVVDDEMQPEQFQQPQQPDDLPQAVAHAAPAARAVPQKELSGFDESDNLMDVSAEFEQVAQLPQPRQVKPKFTSGESEPEAFTSKVVENFSPF